MKALIDPNSKVNLPDGTQGERVAWVCEQEYPSAPPLFWVDCADDVVPDVWYYDPLTQEIKLVPEVVSDTTP